MDQTVKIILPVHNRSHITKKFIDCINKQKYTRIQLIVIDDGSTDNTIDMIKKTLSKNIALEVISGDGNLWWGGSLNEGYNFIFNNNNKKNKDIVLIINDDTTFDENYISLGVKSLQKSPRSSLVSSISIGEKSNKVVSSGVVVNWIKLSFKDTNESKKINCLSTRGLFLYIEDFIKIGSFYPKLLPHYLSDYEYTIRAKNKGYNLLIDDELKIKVNEEETGFHKIDNSNITRKEYLKKYFSKKNPGNPVYWINFVLIRSPLVYKLPNLGLVVLKNTIKISKNLIKI